MPLHVVSSTVHLAPDLAIPASRAIGHNPTTTPEALVQIATALDRIGGFTATITDDPGLHVTGSRPGGLTLPVEDGTVNGYRHILVQLADFLTGSLILTETPTGAGTARLIHGAFIPGRDQGGGFPSRAGVYYEQIPTFTHYDRATKPDGACSQPFTAILNTGEQVVFWTASGPVTYDRRAAMPDPFTTAGMRLIAHPTAGTHNHHASTPVALCRAAGITPEIYPPDQTIPHRWKTVNLAWNDKCHEHGCPQSQDHWMWDDGTNTCLPCGHSWGDHSPVTGFLSVAYDPNTCTPRDRDHTLGAFTRWLGRGGYGFTITHPDGNTYETPWGGCALDQIAAIVATYTGVHHARNP